MSADLIYDALAEELSAPDASLDDFDEDVIAAAREYATEHGLPWPPRPTTSGWLVEVRSW